MTSRMLRTFTGVAAAALVAACETGPTPPPTSPPAQLHLTAVVSAATITNIVVTVSAADISPSLVYNFPVANGVATGTLTVPTGSDRQFRISAFDAAGVETHRADTTITVQSGSNPPLAVTLTPLTGSQPIVVTISGLRIEVQPTDTSMAVGTSAQFRARALNEQGTDITGQVAFVWASTNPSIASVDSQGVVTAHLVGTVSVVAVARGVAGVATLTAVASSAVLGLLDSVYSVLHNTQDDYYNVSEISSDEMVVPTRGQDWYDGGMWLDLHRQTWTAGSPATLTFFNGAWNTAYRGIARANELLGALPQPRGGDLALIAAEARTLRALYYYQLMDMFGGVPIFTTPQFAPQPRNTRAEVFHFIENELLEARTQLPDRWGAPHYERMTKGAADAILASIYLNAAVFMSDLPSAITYNSCSSVQVAGQTACHAAIAAADRILNSGLYSLAADWHSNFAPDNFASPENILVVKNLNQPGLGLNFVMRALHYNQLTPSPWNGFAALAETYRAFDADDRRRQIFLQGPQVNLDTGEPAFDRSGNPLVFTVDIIDETNAGEGEGTRIMKWPPDPNRAGPDNGNDFAYFRLGEILLIKAEALNELTPGSGEALALLNTLRVRVFEPGKPLTTVDRDVILHERLLELTAEAKRRQDLVRHGRYTQAWSFKQAGGPRLVLMPIPQSQLDANPLLVQNPGY